MNRTNPSLKSLAKRMLDLDARELKLKAQMRIYVAVSILLPAVIFIAALVDAYRLEKQQHSRWDVPPISEDAR